jgi:hypothetical protein
MTIISHNNWVIIGMARAYAPSFVSLLGRMGWCADELGLNRDADSGCLTVRALLHYNNLHIPYAYNRPSREIRPLLDYYARLVSLRLSRTNMYVAFDRAVLANAQVVRLFRASSAIGALLSDSDGATLRDLARELDELCAYVERGDRDPHVTGIAVSNVGVRTLLNDIPREMREFLGILPEMPPEFRRQAAALVGAFSAWRGTSAKLAGKVLYG